MKRQMDKREFEKTVITKMIRIYCKHNHHMKDGICRDCEELAAYARTRTDKCPVMETKTFCSSCQVHCYNPEMRERIRTVMRYSGPRLLFLHPVMAARHLLMSKPSKATRA